jgi:hypothetical protein
MKLDGGMVQVKSGGSGGAPVMAADQREGEWRWCTRRVRKGVVGGEGKRGSAGGGGIRFKRGSVMWTRRGDGMVGCSTW